MKFLVDQPLAGLAKWLRFCGFDAQVVRLSARRPGSLPPPQPGVHILTRQAWPLAARRPDLLVITADGLAGQFAEVVRRLNVDPQAMAPLSRCSRCNARLSPVAREEVMGLVPEHVFHAQRDFYQCPACRRLFWPGSHAARISQRLAGQ